MKLDARQRWLVLGGLLTATLAAAAWLGDNAAPPKTELVAAAEENPGAAVRSATRSPRTGAHQEAPQVNLEKLRSRDPGTVSRDPFAVPAPRGATRPGPAAPAPSPARVAVAPSPPGAPPLPFTYMGKLISGEDLAVFLVQGERNLIVHEGDTIDSLYRVEHIAERVITLVYLPLNQRQTIVIGEPQ